IRAERTSTTGASAALVATTSSQENFAEALHAEVTSMTPGGSSVALRGRNNGTGSQGIGVWGSQVGSGFGVYGTSLTGPGVYGIAQGASGVSHGLYGTTLSTTAEASGCYGEGWNTSGVGQVYGVHGLTNSTHNLATGVYGENVGPNGLGAGVRG